MADAKGTGVVFLKNMLKAKSNDDEVIFVRQLTEEVKNVYYKTLSISWIPVENMATMMETAASVLYPDDPMGLYKLGQEEARDNLNGVYKVLLKIATVPFLVKQTAKLWRSYHAAGAASSQFLKGQDREGYMMVDDYPEFPATMREVVRGYISGALGLTRAMNIQVRLDDSNPKSIKWHCQWE